MKTTILFLWSIIMMLVLVNPVGAQLVTIGMAGYDANEKNGIETNEYFKLIWDNDDHLVWLDYSNEPNFWTNGLYQRNWAAGLGSVLDIRLNYGYTLTWTEDTWHLPDTETYASEKDGGHEMTTSDLGHLFYIELGNLPFYYEYTWGNPEVGLVNTGPFENLLDVTYLENLWDTRPGTVWPAYIWAFRMQSGHEGKEDYFGQYHGIAVRGAQVTSPVPVPGSLLMMTCGLAALAGLDGEKNKPELQVSGGILPAGSPAIYQHPDGAGNPHGCAG